VGLWKSITKRSKMKKSTVFISLMLLFALFESCTKKDLELDVEQDACKRFKIETPTYTLTQDPCTNGVSISAEVHFSFNRSEECLHLIENNPVFYTKKNEKITAISFSQIVTRENITISSKEVTYTFTAEFVDVAEAKKLNHIILDFNTENEVQEESNTLQIRINTSCSEVDPSTYDVNSNAVTIPQSQRLFTIQLWDNAAEDGDIVSAYLNGNWIIENHSLLKDTTDFNFSTSILNTGKNDLVLFALNEGSSGPNTVSIAINGKEIPNFKPGLLTGEAVRIDF